MKFMFQRNKKVIPGFKVSMGYTIVYLFLIVLIPLLSIIFKSFDMGIGNVIEVIKDRRILSSLYVSFGCSFMAAIINTIFGVIISWVLVRYKFPFKRFVDGIIDLPFALPTAVAGIALTTLYSKDGLLGSFFYSIGLESSFSKLGITIALIFIGIPFVVRNVQPVLKELDPQYEEAGRVLGANKFQIFFKIILPAISSPLLTGFGLAFARGIGEYGSVVFISGNMPMKTEIAPLMIMSKLEQYDYAGATAIALIMLIISFLILLLINIVQNRGNKFVGG